MFIHVPFGQDMSTELMKHVPFIQKHMSSLHLPRLLNTRCLIDALAFFL